MRLALSLALLALLLTSGAVSAADERLILAHRMIPFGPHFQHQSDRPWGFLFPTRDPAGPDTVGWCREGHIGALHPVFPSRVEEFKWEIRQAQQAGVEGFILDTCGYARSNDQPICDDMITAAAALGGRFKVGLCLDYGWGGNELKVDSVREWLHHHRANPALLRLHGVPAFVTYGSGYRPPEEVATLFAALREAAGEPIHLTADLTEFPNRPPEEWEPAARAYAAHADALTCFYSRQGLARNTEAFGAVARVCHELGKDWAMSLWGNYYSAGRTVNMENIGAENSRLWDGMWRVARHTRADFVQLVTWNDMTEDTTIMPGLRRHFTFCDLLRGYYAPFYKTGQEPRPTRDQVFIFYRPYRTDARRPLVPAPLAPPCAAQNVVEVRSFLVKPGEIVVAGLGRQKVPAGMSTVEFVSRPGPVRVALWRNGQSVLGFTAPEPITDRPWREDYALRGFSSEEAAHWREWFPGQKPAWIGEYRDDDRDGLPNWFEQYYFASWTRASPTADSDGDGKNNLREFREETDPRRAPALYPAGYTWEAVAAFRPDNATHPVADSRGAPVWEFECRSAGAVSWQTAGLLVKQIPAWLERGNSWSFGLGRPREGTLNYFGEGASGAAQVWTSPVTGTVKVTVQATAEPNSAPVTASLQQEGGPGPVWQASLAPASLAADCTQELTVRRGDRYRLSVTAAPAAGRWSVHLGWKLDCLTELRGE